MYLIICHINHTKISMFKYNTTPQKELEYKMQFMIKNEGYTKRRHWMW